MGFYNVINASLLAAGMPEDVSQVLANFNAVASVLNGNLDDTNVNAAAAIKRSKLDFGVGLVNADISPAAALEGSKLNWHLGATPPGSPTDGMLWTYNGLGVFWTFIYDSTEATYKWKFVGGPPASSQAFTADTQLHGSPGWAQPYSVNPQMNVPRAGNYLVEAVCTMFPAANGVTWWMGLQIGGVNPTVDQAWTAGVYSPVASARATPSIATVGVGFTAGQLVAMVYQNNSAQNFTRYNASLQITPSKVI